MLKAELHTHIRGDPIDTFIRYSAYDLIDRAAARGFQVLAITRHNYIYQNHKAKNYARVKGILLLQGMEMTLQGKHTLIYNITPEQAATVKTFTDLQRLKKKQGNILVIAPHPFHYTSTCLDDIVLQYPDLFDAWEYSFFYTKSFNPNQKTVHLAQQLGKPVVGNSDVHDLNDLGRTYTLIDAVWTEKAVIEAIRKKKVQVATEPLTPGEMARILGRMAYTMLQRRLNL
ncbi:MAG: PHP-associated domain-containing protein [Nanoarchaeota archaeon]|nr:PHP-associated domain-containing protein [Nanoarchaeota archaeon]